MSQIEFNRRWAEMLADIPRFELIGWTYDDAFLHARFIHFGW